MREGDRELHWNGRSGRVGRFVCLESDGLESRAALRPTLPNCLLKLSDLRIVDAQLRELGCDTAYVVRALTVSPNRQTGHLRPLNQWHLTDQIRADVAWCDGLNTQAILKDDFLMSKLEVASCQAPIEMSAFSPQ